MSKRLQVYEAEGLVVTFDPSVCVHSAVCLRTLPAVFDVRERRWVRLENADADTVAAAVAQCPSGALQAVRLGRGREGAAPAADPAAAPAVTIGVKANGPLLVRGPVRIIKEDETVVVKQSCSLCRCGATGTAPFCDGSHNRIGFKSPS